MNSFAGIGSRDTPKEICHMMTSIAKYFTYKHNFTLTSGGANGADHAFEIGAKPSNRKIFLPWDGFNGKIDDGINYIVPSYNEKLIRQYHHHFHKLTSKGKLMMSRNAYQVLGEKLLTPVNFVVCWTSDGKVSGGTGHAMRIANDRGIPVYNLKTDIDKFKNFIHMNFE